MMSSKSGLFIVIVIQAVFCTLFLTSFPVSLDEPYSIFYAQQPLTDLLAEVKSGNNAPLHFVLLHFWIKAFGISAFAVRSLSVIVSLITIAVLYRLAQKFFNLPYTLLICGLFTFSRVNHFVAMEARMYGLFTLFFLLILFDFYRFMIESKRPIIRLALWNALLLYTHYIGGVVVMLEVVMFLIYFKKLNAQKWKHAIMIAILGLVLFIPGLGWLLNRGSDFAANGTWVSPVSVYDLWIIPVKLMNNAFTLFFALAIIILVNVLSKQKKTETSEPNQNTDLYYFLYWFLGGFVLLFLISVFLQPVFILKYLQFLSLPLFFVLVFLVYRKKIPKKLKALPFVMLLPFIVSVKPIPDVNRNTDELIKYVQEVKNERTVVYYCPPHYDLTLAYHLNRDFFENYNHTEQLLEKANYIRVYHARDLDLKVPEKVIFIDFESHFLYPNNGIIERLDQESVFISGKEFKGNFRVYAYAVK